MEEDTGMSSTISSLSSSSHLQVMVHPLSMVSMADHCTRCMYHGTPIHEEDMNTNTNNNNNNVSLQQQPIVGLLFGTVSEHKKTLQPSSTSTVVVVVNISDAEDVPILHQNSVNAALTAIELHQAVYTNHICIGWYRVNVIPDHHDTNDTSLSSPPPPTPTADDLILSQQLLQQYSSNRTTNNNTTTPFIFALLNVVHEIPIQDDPNPLDTKIITSSTTTTTTTATATVTSLADQLLQQKKKKKNNDDTTTNKNDNDIPLSLYVVDTQQQVLIGLDYDSITTPSSDTNRSGSTSSSTLPHINTTMNYSWKLVTAPYERIAVERIMEYNSKNNNNNNNNPSTNIQQSLYAIYERLDTLECTLQRLLLQNKATTVTANPSTLALLRHVNSLRLHVSMMSSILIPSTGITSESTTTTATAKGSVDMTTTTATTNTATANTTQLLQQLVTLSETISTIQQYTDKLHIVQQYHRDTTSPNMILKTATTKNTMANMGGNPNTMETTATTTTSRQHTRLNYSMYD